MSHTMRLDEPALSADEMAREINEPRRPPPRGVLVDGWCRYCRKELDAGTICAACAIEKLAANG